MLGPGVIMVEWHVGPFPHHKCPLPSLKVTDDANVMLNGFGTVVNSLGKRAKPYLSQICGTIKWRLNNKAAKIRQQAADLIARIAPVMKACEEEQLLGHLGKETLLLPLLPCNMAQLRLRLHLSVFNDPVPLINLYIVSVLIFLLWSHTGVVLYEYLGEEYPEVLGSILGALKSIVNVIGMTKVRP